MAVDRRTWWALGALVAVAALAVWSQTGGTPQAASRAPAARAARAATAAAITPPAEVQLDRLAAARTTPGQAGRNPFEFQARRAAARPAGEPPPPPPPMPEWSGTPAGATSPPPPIALKFIGVVESATGMKLAVLTDGRMVSHGQEGDIIEGRYRILKIGVESIEMAYVDGRGRQTIRLTGQ
jgi:hypothetical protein